MAPLRGILLMVSAVALFAVMAVCVKSAVRIPPGELVFFRSFCGLPVILAWLAWRGELGAGLRVNNWKSHAVRAIAGSVAMGLGFFGLKLIALPEATAIRFATPLFVVVFAVLILGEKVRAVRTVAVGVGFAGVLVVMAPRMNFAGGDLAFWGALATLCSAALAALSQVFIRSMAATERTSAIVFWFTLTASVLSLASAPFGWVMPVGREWAFLIGAGLIGGLGQILITSSFRFAEASTLSPFTYTSMIWSLLFGWLIFAETPTLPMLAGAALVIASGAAIVLRERHLGHQRTAEGKLRGHE